MHAWARAGVQNCVLLECAEGTLRSIAKDAGSTLAHQRATLASDVHGVFFTQKRVRPDKALVRVLQ